MDLILKWLLVLIFAPVLACIALQLLVGMAAAVLPWLIVFSVVAGLAAGVSAGLVLRRRLPPRNDGSSSPSMPLGPYRVRRPRSGRQWR